MKRFVTNLLATIMALGTIEAGAKPKTYNLDQEHVPGQLIVGFDSDVPAEIKQLVARKLTNVDRGPGPRVQSGGGTYLLDANGLMQESSLHELAEYIESLPGVRFVEANNIYRLQETIPNDPFFDRLYGLRNGDKTDHLNSRDINATFAWNIAKGSKKILVAVLDTGIDYRHPDLVDNYWTNPGESESQDDGEDLSSNGLDDDGNGYIDDFRGWNAYDDNNDPMDGHGHGTHVAGTIGARGNNGIGVTGVNWEVSLVAVKIFSDSGLTNTAAIVTGIDYSTAIGVDVTNNSWGGGAYSEAIYEAISRANDAGILFVAAAGNSSSDNDRAPHYPSSYELPNIIGVASTDRNDRLSSFSSYGKTTVHVAAPGSDIFSTIPNGGYGFKSGTSMATPHVTGLVALVKSHFPEASHLQIKDRILSTSSKLPQLENFVMHGRIDAYSALEEDEIPPSQPDKLAILSTGLRSLHLSWQASGDDGLEGKASRYEIRTFSSAISDENWELASPVSFSVVDENEDFITAEISGLEFNASGYLAIKAFDNVGNVSEVSDSISFSLKAAAIVFENLGDIQHGFDVIEPSWGSEQLDDRLIIACSPGKPYDNNINSSIVTQQFSVSDPDMVLEVKSRYDLETRYDFAYIEIQTGESDWQTLQVLNGYSDWTSIFIELKPYLQESESFRLRFRIKTDYSVVRQGWDIDEIRLLGVADEA